MPSQVTHQAWAVDCNQYKGLPLRPQPILNPRCGNPLNAMQDASSFLKGPICDNFDLHIRILFFLDQYHLTLAKQYLFSTQMPVHAYMVKIMKVNLSEDEDSGSSGDYALLGEKLEFSMSRVIKGAECAKGRTGGPVGRLLGSCIRVLPGLVAMGAVLLIGSMGAAEGVDTTSDHTDQQVCFPHCSRNAYQSSSTFFFLFLFLFFSLFFSFS